MVAKTPKILLAFLRVLPSTSIFMADL